MIKYTLILVNFIGLFLWNLFTGSELLVENNAPTQIAPGDKKEVTIHINKKEIEGFAKMELTLPPGFIVTPGETQGASFTFSQQKARFVWMTMPNMEDFNVTYFIECIDGMQGNYSINGTFSYIKENKRLDYVIPSRSVMVSKDAIAATANSALTSTGTEPQVSSSTSTTYVSSTSVSTSTSTSPSSAASNSTTTSNPTEGISYQNEAAFTQATSNSPRDTSGSGKNVTNEPSMGARSEGFVAPICERTITKLSDTDFEVTVTIRENNIVGFARIYEIVPSNCSTEIAQNAGSMTTREVNTVKFVWFEVPNSPVVVVSYKIHCTEAFAGMPEIKGKLSYVLDQKPVDQAIINAGNQGGDVLAQTTTAPNNAVDTSNADSTKSNDAAVTTTPPAKSTDTTQNIAPQKQDDTAQNTPNKTQNNDSVTPKQGNKSDTSASADNVSPSRSKPVTTVSSAEVGITYKVQILAAHRVVDKSYFRQKHKYDEGFNIENHEGWVKYTTGKFGEYKEARDERERLRGDYESLPGPFVTAYNNGERITVQEALLISKQQWYK